MRNYAERSITAPAWPVLSIASSLSGVLNHDPSRLDRDRGRRRNRLLRCHHDRHKHGRLVRRQRQLAAPRRLAPGKEMLRADLMPACHLRHDRARRKRFRDDPPLVRVTPPSPATNATANLDAPSRRGSVNYMVDHIIYANRCHQQVRIFRTMPLAAKMGGRHRLRRAIAAAMRDAVAPAVMGDAPDQLPRSDTAFNPSAPARIRWGSFTPTSPRKCRRSVKLSQPWGQRNAYEPQKGIEVDALGALNAVPHIGINMVKPG